MSHYTCPKCGGPVEFEAGQPAIDFYLYCTDTKSCGWAGWKSDPKPGSCYICEHSPLCYIRRGFEEEITKAVNHLNIDSADRPGRFTDIYETLAACCLEFKRKR